MIWFVIPVKAGIYKFRAPDQVRHGNMHASLTSNADLDVILRKVWTGRICF